MLLCCLVVLFGCVLVGCFGGWLCVVDCVLLVDCCGGWLCSLNVVHWLCSFVVMVGYVGGYVVYSSKLIDQPLCVVVVIVSVLVVLLLLLLLSAFSRSVTISNISYLWRFARWNKFNWWR